MTPNILTSADAVIRRPRGGGTSLNRDSRRLNPEFLFPETAEVNPEITTAFWGQDLGVMCVGSPTTTSVPVSGLVGMILNGFDRTNNGVSLDP